MATGDFLTLATVALAILIVTPLLGGYIYRVMEGQRTFLSPVLRPVERAVYRVCGVDETAEQDWKGYTIAVLVFAFVAIVAGYIVFRLQDVLPFNQGGIPAMSPDLAFNTSVSFETNTNWQNYSGESGATYLTQAAVLAVRNFTSAATGLAVAIALIRGLTRRSTKTLGNYWVDLTRGVLYILLPISVVGALVLVWQGVPQTWNPTQIVTTLQGATQNIAIGPVASQEWIKELGNNGGGFFNANSSHPFENPTPLTNWLEIFALLACSFSLTYTFGRYAGNQRQGWTIFGAMAAILLVGAVVAMHNEFAGNPLSRPASTRPSATWRARRRGSARPWAGCSPRPRLERAPARSTRGMTASSRSRGSYRCSTWSSARSRRAESVRASTACSSSARSSRCSSRASWSAGRRSTSARRSRASRSRWR